MDVIMDGGRSEIPFRQVDEADMVIEPGAMC